MGLNRAQWWPIDFHGLSWKPMVFLLIILASGLQASPTSWYIVSCLSCWKSVFRPPANHAEELWPSEEASGWTPGKPHLWLSQTFQRAGGNQGPRWKSKLGQNHYWELGKNIGETTIATSVLLVWGQQPCLLERLSFLGPGAKAACERQTLALRTYRLAHWSSGTRAVGRAFVSTVVIWNILISVSKSALT